MRTNSIAALLLTTAAFSAACADSRPVAGPSFSAGAAECPTPPTVVVTDEASLRAALDVAQPGDVIGINGMIGITVDDTIATDDITLTCATPGSGLYAAGSEVFDLVNVFAKHVTIDRLVLDASGALDGPFFVLNDGLTAFAEDDRFTNNSATCSSDGACGFVVGAPRTLIADNQFVASGSSSGLHLQSGVDGTQIIDNTIVAATPSGASAFGGIRVRDGSGVVISGNAVLGPWSNSLAPTDLATSRVAFNRLEGARLSGIRMSSAAVGETRMIDNVFQENRVTTDGAAGVLAVLACRNVFVWNELESTAGGPGIAFFATTGANKLIGSGTTFVDDGAFDCNGDGRNDPNIITGTVRHGMPPDTVSSGPVATVHGITRQ